MDTICLSDLKTMIKFKENTCVSIFVPTQSGSGADPQNIIRFKNLLHKAEEKLIQKGLRSSEARVLIQPAEQLLTDKMFWTKQSKGLVFFLDPNQYFYYRVPIVVPELVVVGPRFYIKPLISMLGECEMFYILVLSQNENRFLQCTTGGCVRVELEGVPKNLAETMDKEVPDSRTQYRSAGAKTTGSETFQISGPGSLNDVNKRYILKYFEEINRSVNKKLNLEKVPLILAGVDYLHPLYKQANSYKYLAKEGITGNQDTTSDDVLMDKALSLVRPFFEKDKTEAISDLLKSAANGKIAHGEKEVIPAAYAGRIKSLFVAEGIQRWGKFDPESNTLSIHEDEEKNDEELIDFAVYLTLSHDGSVYNLKAGDIPGGSDMAGLLRY